MPKILIALATTALLLILVSVGAIAGVRLAKGDIRSFVVDIAQSVPVEISAPIEMESGEVVTVTAPITVNIELRVSVDGTGQAKVINSAIQEPAITETNIVGPNPKIDSLGITYTLEIDSPEFSLTEWTTFVDPNGQFNIAGEAHLTPDAEPVKDIRAVARFYGADGTIIGVEQILNVGYRLTLAGYSRFEHVTRLAPEIIDHYSVDFEVIR